MTEPKLCPFIFSALVGASGPHTANPWTDPRRRCLEDKCQMWRDAFMTDRAILPDYREGDFGKFVPMVGYCGLAGRP
jgi:hypothetical protein